MHICAILHQWLPSFSCRHDRMVLVGDGSKPNLSGACLVTCDMSDSDTTQAADLQSSSSTDGSIHDGIDLRRLFGAVALPDTAASEEITGYCSARKDPVAVVRSQVTVRPAETLSHCAMLKKALEVSGVPLKIGRKRMRGKHMFDANTLTNLTTNPDSVSRCTAISRGDHRHGFHEFRRWYIALANINYREADRMAAKRWTEYTNDQRYHWVIVREAIHSIGVGGLQKAPPRQLRGALHSTHSMQQPEPKGESPIEVVGMLLTYHPKIGMDDPDVGVWIREGYRGAELRQKLLSKPTYHAFFEAFVMFLKKFRDEYAFKSVCACMELGEHSEKVARVHLHAYVGFLGKDSGITGLRPIKVTKDKLTFGGCVPFLVPTRGRMGRRLHEAVCQGMYYVVGPKLTGMLRYTDLEPIQEHTDAFHCEGLRLAAIISQQFKHELQFAGFL